MTLKTPSYTQIAAGVVAVARGEIRKDDDHQQFELLTIRIPYKRHVIVREGDIAVIMRSTK